MNDNVSMLVSMARNMGACARLDGVTGWRSLCSVLTSPSGIEFLQEHEGFPDVGVFREFSDMVAEYGIFVDCGKVELHNPGMVFAVGNSDIHVTVDGPEMIHKVIAMHGAKVRVEAVNYAVVKVYELSGSVECVMDDNSVRL